MAPGDTNNYWITYDLAGAATVSNLIDVRTDSIGLLGGYKIPANNNPSANLVVAAANTYQSASVIHPNIARVPRQGQPNSPVMRIRIITTNTGAPMQVSQFNLATSGGGNDTANIAAARLYYTGNINAFSTQTPFGNNYAPLNPTTASWNPYVISGSQYLNFDTNYFWLAYDIKTSAIAGDSVDAELTSFVLNGATNTPGTVILAGSFKIELPYCKVSFSGLGTALPAHREEITRVIVGTLDNASTCSQTGGTDSELNIYSNYTEIVTPLNIRKNEATTFSLTGVSNCGATTATAATVFSIYIDLNKDGDFADAGENIYRSASAAGVLAGRTITGNIVIPCTALTGLTRMRVIYAGGNPATASCGALGQFGEAEDYTINIQDNPIAYDATKTYQTTQIVAAGFTDIQAMRIAVKAKGCGSSTLSAMYFNTTGSTNAAGDIASATLYTTGVSNQFVNPVTVSTTTVSSNQLVFTALNSPLLNALNTDSNYFWLVLNIRPSATATNIVDVALDSINAIGGMRTLTSAQGNPPENIKIANKMAYVATAVTHPDLSSVSMGFKNKPMLRVLIAGSANGAPVTLSDIQFSTTGGGDDLANIDSARVYFTGKNPAFSTSTPFGQAYAGMINPWGTFSVSGNQTLTADTNYFWLAYDIKSNAALFDSVDASLVSFTFDGVSRSVPASPNGVVNIKYDYCASAGYSENSPFFGSIIYNITSVKVNSLSNTSTCALTPTYGNHTALPATNIAKGTLAPFKIKATYCGTSLMMPTMPNGYLTIYIDYDQSGSFTSNEIAYTGSVITADTLSGNLLIPCTAKAGQTRMRILLSSNTAVMSACGTANATIGYGETEDYTVNITDAAISYTSSAASQQNGFSGRGMNDQVIMKFKINAGGCGHGELNKVYFNTAGSTNPAGDITAAKLYKTNNDVLFNTSKLLGTYSNPSNRFDFTLADSLLAENNYWLVYDISPGATLNNTVDVRLDSVQVIGQHRIPSNNNPSQSRIIDAPMSFTEVFAVHTPQDRAPKGSAFAILNIKVLATAGSPLDITAFNLNTSGGGIDTANILSAKIYYTGNSNTFATVNQFGATYTPGTAITGTKWNAYSITGSTALMADTNNFWLVYQLKASAIAADSVDAELASVRVDNLVRTPTSGIPAGSAIIREEYCIPGPVSGRCIDTVIIGNINHASGTSCASPYYTLFPVTNTTTTSVSAGSSLPVRLTFSQPTRASIFIDLNRNGIFEPAEEYYIAPQVNVPDINTSIFIPATALTGETSLRIRTFGGQSTGVVTNRACNDWNQSSTHDYTITILPAVPPTTYVWNQTSPASFITPSNWTPARFSASPTDHLVFPSSSNEVVVNNLSGQVIGSLEIALNTKVRMNAQAQATLVVSDIMTLGNEALLSTNSNVIIQIGETSTKPGVLDIGYNAGIQSTITRFIGSSNSTNISFPIVDNKGAKKVRLDYGGNSVFGSVTVSFVGSNPGGYGGLPLYEGTSAISINRIANSGYWEITPSPDLANTLYTAVFEADSIAGIQSPNSLVLINRTNMFNDWMLNGYHFYSTGSNAHVEMARYSMYGYGQFAIGSDSMLNLLPVKLLSFTGNRVDNNVQLKWTTASETNNKGFEVLRSFDGKQFKKIVFVEGNNNTGSISNYAYTDIGIGESRQLYYRLKQIDNNGASSMSNIVIINNNLTSAFPELALYPNPFNKEVFLSVSATAPAQTQIELFDATGKKLWSRHEAVIEGVNTISLQNTKDLSSGLYFVGVTINGQKQIRKIIKQ